MASYNYTFTSGDTVTPTKLNSARTVSDIVNADVSATAAIAGTKVAPAFGAQDITVSTANRSITNTGNFALSFGTNNTERVRITQDGILSLRPVGAEGGQLEVVNPDNATVGMFIDVSSADTARIFTASATTGDLQIGQLTGTGGITRFFTAGTERMRIDASGNVGIGTAVPASKFAVSTGDNRKQFTVDFSSDPVVKVGLPDWYDTGAIAFVNGSGGERMRIDASGNVWIGTTSGSEKLDVVGNIAARATSATGAAGFYSYINGVVRSSFSTDMAALAGNGVSYLDVQNTLIVRDTNAAYAERMRIDASGNVGIGGTANAAAILDVASTTKGFLPPRMTNTQRNAIATPPAGLVIYNTTTNNLNFYNGTAWTAI
jgi:hypothetical protein